jgi:hypothetical protein
VQTAGSRTGGHRADYNPCAPHRYNISPHPVLGIGMHGATDTYTSYWATLARTIEIPRQMMLTDVPTDIPADGWMPGD